MYLIQATNCKMPHKTMASQHQWRRGNLPQSLEAKFHRWTWLGTNQEAERCCLGLKFTLYCKYNLVLIYVDPMINYPIVFCRIYWILKTLWISKPLNITAKIDLPLRLKCENTLISSQNGENTRVCFCKVACVPLCVCQWIECSNDHTLYFHSSCHTK